jgi:hypothetical protein
MEEQAEAEEGEVTDIMQTQFVVRRLMRDVQCPLRPVGQVMKYNNTPMVQLMKEDQLAWDSLLMMPYSVIQHTTSRLPKTDILTRSILATTPLYKYRLFNMLQRNPERLVRSSELNNSTDLDRVIHMDNRPGADASNSDILKSNLPSLTSVIDRYLPVFLREKKGVYSYSQLFRALEPFGIYESDMAVYAMPQVRRFLSDVQSEFRARSKDWASKFNVYSGLRLGQSPAETASTFMETITGNGKVTANRVQEYYGTMAANANEANANEAVTTKSKKTQTPQEILNQVTDVDGGELLFLVIKQLTATLMVDPKEQPELDEDLLVQEATKPDPDCQNRMLVKKYKTTLELTKDNGKTDVVVDSEMDPTDYTQLNVYKSDYKSQKSNQNLVDYIVDRLVKDNQEPTTNKKMPEREARKLAENLVRGHRLVHNGEYAVLELTPVLPPHIREETLSDKEREAIEIERDVRRKRSYYVRKRDAWVHDSSLDDLSFANMSDIICGLSTAKCVNKDALSGSGLHNSAMNATASQCSSLDNVRASMQAERVRLLREVAKRYDMTVSSKLADYSTEIDSLMQSQPTRRRLLTNSAQVFDRRMWSHGQSAVTDEVVVSPYTRILEAILGRGIEGATRHQYILKFVNHFCRDPYVADTGESQHWLYCKDTGVKLVPRTMHELAMAHRDGNYTQVLNRLCNSGTLSEDGAYVIDPHTGFVLKQRDFREDYVVESTEFAEAEAEAADWSAETTVRLTDVIVKTVNLGKDTRTVYTDPADRIAYNRISTLARHVGADSPELRDRAMLVLNSILRTSGKLIPPKKAYDAKRAEIIKRREAGDTKVKEPDMYDKFVLKRQLYLTVVAVVAVIQTAIPGYKIYKTYPGCSRVMDEYPLIEDIDRLGTIEYFACIVRKMYSNSPDANLVSNTKEIRGNLIEVVKTAMTLPGFLKMYTDKRDYLEEQAKFGLLVSPEIPIQMNVAVRWRYFMPPMFPVHPSSQSLALPKDWNKSGNRADRIPLDNIRALIMAHSIAVAQTIREVVASQDALFVTKGGHPYLENACCAEAQGELSTALAYFEKIDKTIASYVNQLRNLAVYYGAGISRSKPSTGVIPIGNQKRFGADSNSAVFLPVEPDESDQIQNKEREDERNKKQENIMMTYNDDVLYTALIKYGKLDSVIYPIPEDLHSIISEKPGTNDRGNNDRGTNDRGNNDGGFPVGAPIHEQIEFLKRHDISMDGETMVRMMNIVFRRSLKKADLRNTVANKLQNRTAVQVIQHLERFTSRPENVTDLSNICQTFNTFIQHLSATATATSASRSTSASTSATAITELESYLIEANTKGLSEISLFIQRNNSTTTSTEITDRLSLLNLRERFGGTDTPVSAVADYMSHMLSQFAVIFPAQLLRKILPSIDIPKHWELIDQDVMKLHNTLHFYAQTDYSASLTLLYGDSELAPVLSEMVQRFRELKPVFDLLGTVYNDVDFSGLYKDSIDDGSPSDSVEEEDGVDGSRGPKDKYGKMMARKKGLYCNTLRFFAVQVFRSFIWLTTSPTVSVKISQEIQQANAEDNGIDVIESRLDDNLAGKMLDDLASREATSRLYERTQILQERVATMIWLFIGNMRTRVRASVKEPAAMSYRDIIREIDFSKDREKQKIKEHFKCMSAEERRVTREMKKLKLGDFHVSSKDFRYGAKQLLVGGIDTEGMDAAEDEPIVDATNDDINNIDWGSDDEDEGGENNDNNYQSGVRDEDGEGMDAENEDDTKDIMENAYDMGYSSS